MYIALGDEHLLKNIGSDYNMYFEFEIMRHICTKMFTAALFIVSKRQKQPDAHQEPKILTKTIEQSHL